MEPNSILDQFRKAVDIGNWEAIQGLGNFILTSPDSLDKEAVIERSLIEFQQCLDNDWEMNLIFWARLLSTCGKIDVYSKLCKACYPKFEVSKNDENVGKILEWSTILLPCSSLDPNSKHNILNTCVDYFNQFLNYNDPKTTYQFAVLILPYISLDEDYKNSFISNCLMVLNDVISDAEMICAWLTFFMQNANRETKIKIYEYLVPLFQNTYQNQDLPLLRVLFVFLLDHPNMEYKSWIINTLIDSLKNAINSGNSHLAKFYADILILRQEIQVEFTVTNFTDLVSNQLESIQNQYGSIPNRHGSIQNQDGSIPIHTLQNPSNQKKEKVYRDLVDRGYIEEDCELASRDSNTYAEALIKLREKYQIK